ncbi:Hypothetical predicted protein, partial [Mytilus galloprovincialis]
FVANNLCCYGDSVYHIKMIYWLSIMTTSISISQRFMIKEIIFPIVHYPFLDGDKGFRYHKLVKTFTKFYHRFLHPIFYGNILYIAQKFVGMTRVMFFSLIEFLVLKHMQILELNIFRLSTITSNEFMKIDCTFKCMYYLRCFMTISHYLWIVTYIKLSTYNCFVIQDQNILNMPISIIYINDFNESFMVLTGYNTKLIPTIFLLAVCPQCTNQLMIGRYIQAEFFVRAKYNKLLVSNLQERLISTKLKRSCVQTFLFLNRQIHDVKLFTLFTKHTVPLFNFLSSCCRVLKLKRFNWFCLYTVDSFNFNRFCRNRFGTSPVINTQVVNDTHTNIEIHKRESSMDLISNGLYLSSGPKNIHMHFCSFFHKIELKRSSGKSLLINTTIIYGPIGAYLTIPDMPTVFNRIKSVSNRHAVVTDSVVFYHAKDTNRIENGIIGTNSFGNGSLSTLPEQCLIVVVIDLFLQILTKNDFLQNSIKIYWNVHNTILNYYPY